MKVQVLLFKGKGIGAALIRWFTFSRWNHAGIRVGGHYYESTFRQGVTRALSPWVLVPSGHMQVIDVEVNAVLAPVMVRWLDGQIGRPYDWRAIVALPWRKRWQSSTAWFCSELVAEALRAGGVPAVRRLPSYRVTPRDLWLALPDVADYSVCGWKEGS